MLHDGHKLDVGVVEALDVFDEGVGELAVGKGVAVSVLHPAFEVDFVDAHGGFEPLGFFAGVEPGFVVPLVAGPLMDDAGGKGRDFGAEGVGVALELFGVVKAAFDEVFVDVAGLDAGDEEFPDAAIAEAHGMAAGVPIVEDACDGDGEGGGGPDGEADACYVVDGLGVGSEGFPGAVESAFGVEVEIEIGNDGAEAVGVVDGFFVALDGMDFQLVVCRIGIEIGGEETGFVDPLHFDVFGGELDGGGDGVREEGADGPAGFRVVGSQDAEGVGVVSADDSVNFFRGHTAIMATVISADTELHVHLEGSLTPELLCRLDPSLTLEEAMGLYRFDSFGGFIEAFKAAARRLRGPEDYSLAASALFESLASQGVRYAEVIFSAGVVEWKGQSLDAVWGALREAAAGALLEVRWNVDVVRQFGGEPAERVAEWAGRHVLEGIVSFGIGGDETARPASEFARAVAVAREAGLKFTPHAGETSTAENVWEMVRMGADRIGHGIRSVEDAKLMAVLREREIALEVCPTSNLRTGAVASLAAHPLRALFDAGVMVTLNSDDPAIFGCSLAGEFEVARRMGFTEMELAVIAENARRCRFEI